MKRQYVEYLHRSEDEFGLMRFVDQYNGYNEKSKEDKEEDKFEIDDEYDEKTNPRGRQDPQIRAESITYLIMLLCDKTGEGTF